MFPQREVTSDPTPKSAVISPLATSSSPHERIEALAQLTSSSAQLAAVARWTDFESVDEIRAMLDKLDSVENSRAKKLARVLLLKQWIELDPTGILDDPSAGAASGGLQQIVLLWCELDPDAAIGALQQNLASQPRFLALALAQIGAVDPELALGLLEKYDLVADRFYLPVFAALAAEDLQNAAALAAGLMDIEDPKKLANSSENGRRAAALAAVATEWVRTDGLAAMAWLQGLPDADSPAARTAFNVLLARWSEADPQSFLRNLDALPTLDRDRRYHAAQAAADWWRTDPTAALDWIEGSVLDAAFSGQIRAAIANMAAMTDDLPAAFELLGAVPAGEDRVSVVASIAEGAILTDTEGAIDWLASLDDPAEQEAAANRAASALAQHDPAAALEHIDALAAMLNRPKGYHFGYQAWEEIIPHVLVNGNEDGEATAWLETLPPLLRDDALKKLAENWAGSDPLAAAEYIANQPDSESQVRATQEVIRQWARYEPAEAARWAIGLAEGQNRELALKNIASHWTPVDPAAASDWIAELPDSRSRDAAAATFAASSAPFDPGGALRMAKSIGDAETRRRALTDTLNTWDRSDSAAARFAVEALALPEKEVEAVRAGTSL